MICHPSKFTPSKIFCCNSTAPESACRESLFHPPKCLSSTIECSAATGGGCCPKGLICSPNGCIQIKQSSIVGLSADHPTASGTDSIKGSTTIMMKTVTVTQSPASTATLTKEGEICQEGVAVKKSMVFTFRVPYVSASVLVCIAALMGML